MQMPGGPLAFVQTPIYEPAKRLRDLYSRYFEAQEADTESLRNECYALRYQVYCIENQYEESDGRSKGIESDGYDSHSKHSLLRYCLKGNPVGTVRMVYPNADKPEESFALQALVDWTELNEADYYPVETTGEISRFCVTKDFRRRVTDPKSAVYPGSNPLVADELRRVIPNMTLGLIEWLVRVSVRDGLTHWAAVMEPALLRVLARLGIHFEPIGGLVEFHGIRQPCVAELGPMLERVRRERPDVWSVLTADGLHTKGHIHVHAGG